MTGQKRQPQTDSITAEKPGKKATLDPTKAQTMADLLSSLDYKIPVFKRGDEVVGRIVQIHPKRILIDIGGKSYGVVPKKEVSFISDLLPSLKEGESITAKVLVPEDENGQLILSLKKSGMEKRWQLLEEAYQDKKEIEVSGVDVVKGGLLVDYAGIRGFIPANQLDLKSADNPIQLRNRKIAVKILELDRVSNRFVVSQKAVTQKDLVELQKKALKKVKEGDELTAYISGLVPFGAFAQVPVKLKGEKESIELEGLIHISEIAWERVDDPALYLKVGDSIKVKVIGKDTTEGKLNLSIKQLTTDPWKKIKEKYKEESVVKGKITRVSPFGVFVELEKGVEGLIHVSKAPTTFTAKVGDKVEAIVESIDTDKRKLSLSLLTKEKPIGYR